MRRPHVASHVLLEYLLAIALSVIPITPVRAQSTATIEGQVVDERGEFVPRTNITLRDLTVSTERFTLSDAEGRYQVAAVPAGNYRLQVSRPGFQAQVLENIRVEVGRRLTYDFRLRVGEISEQVIVAANGELIERSTISVGHIVDQRTVQDVPLNGRYFLDLALLGPGSVTPPQNGFGTTPIRGSGAFAINTAGNREDTVNYLINGITLNNQWFNSISFQPSISSVREFKLDN